MAVIDFAVAGPEGEAVAASRFVNFHEEATQLTIEIV